MVAVVGLDDDREADAPRRAHGLAPRSARVPGAAPAGRASPRIWLVSSLSLASSTAMCGVRPVTVAWMRCWYVPWPSCTSDWSLRRSHGMSRASAARTSEAVDGPSARRWREADELVARLGPGPALGHAVRRADRLGQQRAQQPQAELAGRDALVALRVLVDDRVHAGRGRRLRVLPKVTFSPATFCSSIATCSSTWPSQVPSSSRMRRKKPPGSP